MNIEHFKNVSRMCITTANWGITHNSEDWSKTEKYLQIFVREHYNISNEIVQ